MVGSAGPHFAERTSIIGKLTRGGTGSSNAPVRRFRLFFATPDLQAGSRITSLKLVAGVGVAPTEAEVMGLA